MLLSIQDSFLSSSHLKGRCLHHLCSYIVSAALGESCYVSVGDFCSSCLLWFLGFPYKSSLVSHSYDLWTFGIGGRWESAFPEVEKTVCRCLWQHLHSTGGWTTICCCVCSSFLSQLFSVFHGIQCCLGWNRSFSGILYRNLCTHRIPFYRRISHLDGFPQSPGFFWWYVAGG